jgi:hypothetical protein
LIPRTFSPHRFQQAAIMSPYEPLKQVKIKITISRQKVSANLRSFLADKVFYSEDSGHGLLYDLCDDHPERIEPLLQLLQSVANDSEDEELGDFFDDINSDIIRSGHSPKLFDKKYWPSFANGPLLNQKLESVKRLLNLERIYENYFTFLVNSDQELLNEFYIC